MNNSQGSNSEMPAVRTTIVGGRPPGSGKMIGDIPRGIEVLVKKASVDSAFKAMLLAQRAGAAGEIGLVLDASEAAILDLVPAGQLEAIIAATRVEPAKKSAFLGKAAAVMLVALGAATGATKAQVDDGIRPATPATAPAGPPVMKPAGILAGPIRMPIASQPTTASQPATSTQPVTQPAQAEAKPPIGIIARPPIAIAGVMIDPTIGTDQPSQPASQPTTWPAVPAEKVEALLPQLDSEDFKQREVAQKAMIDLGPGAVPVIQDILAKKKDLSLEVQARLQRVIRALQPTPEPVRPIEVRATRGVRAMPPQAN
jgi:hypothetical protein